jgi:hypothetical protein
MVNSFPWWSPSARAQIGRRATAQPGRKRRRPIRLPGRVCAVVSVPRVATRSLSRRPRAPFYSESEHPGWLQSQEISTSFLASSQRWLQYSLSLVTVHLQAGCAHFFRSRSAMVTPSYQCDGFTSFRPKENDRTSSARPYRGP